MNRITPILLCLLIGCPQSPGDRGADPLSPTPVIATSETEFVAALVRAIERGDFDDTDDFVLVAGKAGKALGIKKVASLERLDVTKCQPLKSESERKEFAERLK